jgi:hypothetical protein
MSENETEITPVPEIPEKEQNEPWARPGNENAPDPEAESGS